MQTVDIEKSQLEEAISCLATRVQDLHLSISSLAQKLSYVSMPHEDGVVHQNVAKPFSSTPAVAAVDAIECDVRRALEGLKEITDKLAV